MNNASLQEIKDAATKAIENGLKWHYHLMSPTCSLNISSDFALVYEQEGMAVKLVHYSPNAEMEFSKELATMLHGADVINESPQNIEDSFDPDTTAVLELARSLTDQNITWHHHVLFPGCTFNPNAPKFTLMLENPTNKQVLSAVSDSEPKGALRHIEKLFYKGV